MAPSLQVESPSHPLSPGLGGHWRRISGGILDFDSVSNGAARSVVSRRVSRKTAAGGESSTISNVVYSLKRRSGDELGGTTSSKLMNANHATLLDWIRHQRMSKIPPEGSSYDKVLAWAQLFVERLHSFDLAIEHFAGDSYLAAQLAYGYCAILLELGEENSSALRISFGFFYSISMVLVNLLERTELFAVSQEIKEQLVLALTDLVTLVASVSTYFHKALRGLTKPIISVNIYGTFSGQIESFRSRCDKISEAMWKHQLLKDDLDGERVSEVKSIRQWLAPEDRVLANVAENTSHLAHDREELTCLWLSPYLTRFLKSEQLKGLSITGASGSGKTVLASVIVDHLQHPIGGVTYNTLFIPINARVPVETEPQAVVKSILRQLFEKRIGNTHLFQVLSDAYDRSKKVTVIDDYEKILWDALDTSLGTPLRGSKPLVLVVDGLDEASGSESILLQRLQAATKKTNNLKLVVLGSQKFEASNVLTNIHITSDLIFDDIAAVIRNGFETYPVYTTLPETDQEILIERITQAANGSFLWAKLTAKLARSADSAGSLQKFVNSIVTSKLTITDLVTQFLQSPDLTDEAKLMVIWLATAQRPLSQSELSTLLSIQIDKATVTDRKFDVLKLLKPVNSLVCVEDGYVYLRHGQVRSAVIDVFSKGKLVPTVKDRHADLLRRLFVYSRFAITEDHEPSLTSFDRFEKSKLLDKYVLLDFSLRYWFTHLCQTTTFTTDGEAGAAKEFGKLFPTSTTFYLLQQTVWEHRPIPTLLSWYTTVTKLTRNVLTPNHLATLQSILTLALFYRQIGRYPESGQLFYEAISISRTVLNSQHIITTQLASLFLEVTAEKVTETRTDIMTKREEILRLLVEAYKTHYGATSEIVISTLTQLAEHYQLIKEDSKAREIYLSLRSATIQQYGADSQEARDIGGSLHVHLTGHTSQIETDTQTTLLLDVEERDELLESETQNFWALLKKAEQYSSESQFQLAEKTFVQIWQQASKECRMHYSSEWEEKKFKAVLAYSKFLKAQKREYEASSLLTTTWQEYEQTSVATETSISYIAEIAKVMKSVGLSSLALSVYKRVSQFYESTSRTQTSAYKEIQESIHITSQEVLKVVSTSSSVVSETTLEEIVYEASSSITTVDQTSITATSTLFEMYISQHRWHDGTRLIKRVLQGIWPTLFAPSLQDVTLPGKHVEHCIELAERLSQCYHARRRIGKEEDIRARIYRAVRSDRQVGDKLLDRVTTELLRLFERTSQTDKVITLRQELLGDYLGKYGLHHSIVITNLWALAELTRPRPIFVDYYRQIITAINKDSDICLPDAFEPLVIVATELWTQGRYSDAVSYYQILYKTFLQQPKLNPKFEDQEFVKSFFTRYTHSLRALQTEFAVIHKITVDYQARVKAIFGATASITIQASLTLAKICQESKRFEIEAIHLYEELLKIKSDEIDYQEITATLDAIYEEQTAIVTSTQSESVSSAQIERAASVLKRRITTVRKTHGWAHEESLSKMQEMISFYSKRNETETVVKELKEATVQILTTETSSTRLIASASTIATSYIASNQIQKATELSHEVYRQIVMKDSTNAKSVSFDLTSKDRQSLVFLAQFEYSLRQNSSLTLNEIFSSLTTEYIYFEEYRSQLRSTSTTLQSLTFNAARLHAFLLSRERHSIATRVYEDFLNYFLGTEGKRIKLTEISQARIFTLTLLNYFSVHSTKNFLRSIGIASYEHTQQLITDKRYDAAADLALAAFRYISAHEEYRSTSILKFVFQLGLAVAGRNTVPASDEGARSKLLKVSSVILQEAFKVVKELKINLTRLSLGHLNNLIALLGEQQDYRSLSWLLTLLWNSRDAQRSWPPSVTFALGRRFILVRYLVGEVTGALRLAEDIVYNCRRVHGPRHPSTLEMSVLLSQLYTSVAQRYQNQKSGQEIAHRYYKKSAAVHENILRVFSDPSFAELEGGDMSMSMDGSTYSMEFGNVASSSWTEGQHVRQHLALLKLAIERLGDWPKDYSEFERLNADIFREFKEDLNGVEGVEKWAPKKFGSGKAERNDDLLDTNIKSWEIVDASVLNGAHAEEEEEL
ncbi:NACHT domain protein [Talaromyces stipitatus ATCC 10500]|uniref:NACHT domain protein n=1 Tax=Talaromyces stipitatus (strain ATCC 10500 / CBS 375.48 / QM 6759 / NRRL 1006) TaxID=441959 RepID=B8M946_TALSN|nr:NACHT domain protein [Talaromyces stipitatus ATCC 10500]EED17341.1 NACHT domain protein [Talaromyces stipitatus ATCC 10500]